MKNSFYLDIPQQQSKPDLVVKFTKSEVNRWVSSLSKTDHEFALNQFYQYIKGFSSVEMQTSHRLDSLEIFRNQFEELKVPLLKQFARTGFPKNEQILNLFEVLIAVEKELASGYWIATNELTRRSANWFRGKNASLAIERTIFLFSEIIFFHRYLYLSIPDWIWIDLHTMYSLSVKAGKSKVKVSEDAGSIIKQSSSQDRYIQVLLFDLVDTSVLLQPEMKACWELIQQLSHLVSVGDLPVANTDVQCVISTEEDKGASFGSLGNNSDGSEWFLDLGKFNKALLNPDKFLLTTKSRFASLDEDNYPVGKLPVEVFANIKNSWIGTKREKNPVFEDRLDRKLVLGLTETHRVLLNASQDEILVRSYSDSELFCELQADKQVSIGSLVSFRVNNDEFNKRELAVISKIQMSGRPNEVIFEVNIIAANVFAVTYSPWTALTKQDQCNALIYSEKSHNSKGSCLLIESGKHQSGDIMWLNMNNESFPIILGGRQNIGSGYWQFECRKLEEKQIQEQKIKKKYGFV